MPGVQAVRCYGPDTFEVSEPVTGGQLVAPSAGGLVGVAGDAAATVLGVAESDAMPASTDPSGSTAYGAPVLDISVPDARVAVAWTGVYRLVYSTAATFGQTVVAAAAGQVRPYDPAPAPGHADTPDLIVGRCVEPDGVAAGDKAETRLALS